jgi:hypothetical protein
MLEPRGALHSTLLRRESVASEEEALPCNSVMVHYEQHAEPSVPIHPSLEYEVMAEAEYYHATRIVRPRAGQHEDSDDDTGEGSSSTSQQRPVLTRNWTNDIKLLVAFVFLVASGVGTVVSAKLQAIPM